VGLRAGLTPIGRRVNEGRGQGMPRKRARWAATSSGASTPRSWPASGISTRRASGSVETMRRRPSRWRRARAGRAGSSGGQRTGAPRRCPTRASRRRSRAAAPRPGRRAVRRARPSRRVCRTPRCSPSTTSRTAASTRRDRCGRPCIHRFQEAPSPGWTSIAGRPGGVRRAEKSGGIAPSFWHACDVSPRAMSAVLVGRSAELDELEDALAAAPGAVLLGGDAGLGKTRLIREFAQRVGERARVLVGGCLELGSDGLPFAPFTTVLRALVRDIGTEGVAGFVPRGDTGGLARLLPEFGEPESDAASGEERARLFEVMLTLLERLAEQGPVVLVVEDAHWADRSTRDLLAFLIRNLGTAPILIVVTYRSDELHRTHPLRPLLAGLERVEHVRRTEIAPLSRTDVAELVTELLGRTPPAGLVERIAARSEGNPLFIEALLDDDGTLASGLPESLRDLLLAGVQRLPEETQEVLRDASGGGTRIEHALLAAVTGLGHAALTRVLRPAVAANVLVVDGDAYAFRHALIREAVHDDLLPGEY